MEEFNSAWQNAGSASPHGSDGGGAAAVGGGGEGTGGGCGGEGEEVCTGPWSSRVELARQQCARLVAVGLAIRATDGVPDPDASRIGVGLAGRGSRGRRQADYTLKGTLSHTTCTTGRRGAGQRPAKKKWAFIAPRVPA